MLGNKESVQLINTAIIKGKEKKVDSTYEQRLTEVCSSAAINAICDAIAILAEKEKISHDQASIQIIDTIKTLDCIWNDYIFMEGLNNLKKVLKERL